MVEVSHLQVAMQLLRSPSVQSKVCQLYDEILRESPQVLGLGKSAFFVTTVADFLAGLLFMDEPG